MNSDFNSPATNAAPASGPAAGPAQQPSPAASSPARSNAFNPGHGNSQAPAYDAADAEGEHPQKSFLVHLFLATSMGQIGIDRIYLGKTGTGVLKFITLGGFGVWALIDAILAAFGKARVKGDDRHLKGYAENRGWIKTALIMYVVFFLVYVVGMVLLFMYAFNHSDDTDTPSRGGYNRQLDDNQQFNDSRMRRFDDNSVE